MLDIGADMPELKAPTTSYAARGDRFWVAQGVTAAARQARSITLWTDTRFEAAHAFYTARGFRQTGQRHLDDASQSVEYGFRKDF